MSEPPADIPVDVLVSQIAKSVIAEEKLLVLETKSREAFIGKAIPERIRKDARMPTSG